MESLNTLVSLCEEGLDVKPDLVEHLSSVWMQLRREILAPPTDSVEDGAVRALTSVTVLLATGAQEGTTVTVIEIFQLIPYFILNHVCFTPLYLFHFIFQDFLLIYLY